MAVFDNFENPSSGQAVRYDFGHHIPKAEQGLLNDVYLGSGVADWVAEHSMKSGEVVRPTMLYVAPDTMHRVAWVKHEGLRETKAEKLVSYAVHHVVCDCAAGTKSAAEFDGDEQKILTEGLPRTSLRCETVDDVLKQRATELGAEHRIAEALGTYTFLDEDEDEFYLTSQGIELGARSIAYLLEIDKNHPYTWAANRINGLHEIELLAAFLGQSTREIMPILETLETSSVILINGNEVKLRDNRIATGVDVCDEDEIRDALASAIQYKDAIGPQAAATMLQKLLHARVTQQTPSLMSDIQRQLDNLDLLL